MPVIRVESLIYGVEDVAAGTQYFEEWGLACREKGAKGAEFALPTGQSVQIRAASDPSLPKPIEGGSTVRETVWGVDGKAALEEVGAELARDRQVRRDADGSLHTTDDIGLPIAFRVAAPGTDPGLKKPRGLNQTVPIKDRVSPIRLGHVVYFCPKPEVQKASAFYAERLKFRVTDRALDLGDFMRCPGSPWHHNIFFLTVLPKKGWNHAAFDVEDVNEVVTGGHRMLAKGYKPYSSLGRHIMGSNVFWYFHSPCGGQTEYSADMDQMDDNWQTRVWEHNPGADMWQFTKDDIVPPRYPPPPPGR
jgi:catechol 2,3-dioxygenase-like lactoylglutathione lyase family enzyme